MLEILLKQILPPGVSMQDIGAVIQKLAQDAPEALKLVVATVQRIEAMQAEQGAMLRQLIEDRQVKTISYGETEHACTPAESPAVPSSTAEQQS